MTESYFYGADLLNARFRHHPKEPACAIVILRAGMPYGLRWIGADEGYIDIWQPACPAGGAFDLPYPVIHVKAGKAEQS